MLTAFQIALILDDDNRHDAAMTLIKSTRPNEQQLSCFHLPDFYAGQAAARMNEGDIDTMEIELESMTRWAQLRTDAANLGI